MVIRKEGFALLYGIGDTLSLYTCPGKGENFKVYVVIGRGQEWRRREGTEPRPGELSCCGAAEAGWAWRRSFENFK